MSEQNVELHRRALAAFNARDVDAWVALADPEIELHSVFATVGGTVHHGHDAVLFGDLEEVWGAERRFEPEAFFDFDERTLVFYVAHGRGSKSELQVAMPAAAVARWRDGLCVYLKGYVHREDALRDLGVSEDALKPILDLAWATRLSTGTSHTASVPGVARTSGC